ncbi:hypothetical protein ACFQ1S_02885 [Kibdelosporangium lantanae]|uniref:Rubredoxin n=1 Tax=Kibdelosporangium lantanae TaxID=1497396 RepID=A0ABW3M242_9PSEU
MTSARIRRTLGCMVTEFAIERYTFTCTNCGHTWSADYDVQYLEDRDGDEWAFYRLNGQPVIAPTEETHLCPVCGRGRVFVDLVAQRRIPLASLDSDEPRVKVTAGVPTT